MLRDHAERRLKVVFASIERFGEFRQKSSQFMSRSRARTRRSEKFIFYISKMCEFSHSLDPDRTFGSWCRQIGIYGMSGIIPA